MRPKSSRRQVDKTLSDLIQYPRMRHIYRLLLLSAGSSLLLLTGCATGTHVSAGGPYHVTAYKPNNPSAVRVKVSLSKGKRLRNGGRPLPDVGGHFSWHGLETYAQGQFQHLFETGAQTFWIVRIQRARRSNSSFYWRWAWALRRISHGILV